MRTETQSFVRRGIARGRIQRILDVFLAIPLIVVVTSLRGATLHVRNTSDSGPGSLRETLEKANAQGDTVVDLREINGRIELEAPLPLVTASIQLLGPNNGAFAISGQRRWTIL